MSGDSQTVWVTVTTVDAIHAEVIGELLGDRGVAFRFVEPERRHQLPDLVRREQLALQVAAADRERARELLGQLATEGEEAVDAQWNADASAVPAPPARRSGVVAWLIDAIKPALKRFAGGVDDAARS